MKPIAAVPITMYLTETVEAFCRFVEAAANDASGVAVAQAWGTQQVLAHLVYHHEIYATQAEAAVTGEPAALPKGTFNELNALAVRQLAHEPLPVLLSRLRLANEKLCRMYDEHDLSETAIRVKKGSTAWKLSNLLPAVASHIQTHHKQLEK